MVQCFTSELCRVLVFCKTNFSAGLGETFALLLLSKILHSIHSFDLVTRASAAADPHDFL